jgi:hypothetical protein
MSVFDHNITTYGSILFEDNVQVFIRREIISTRMETLKSYTYISNWKIRHPQQMATDLLQIFEPFVR